MTTATTSAASYLDFSSFDEMRLKSKKDKNGALRDVATQFESIFLKMALKSMRDASLGDEMLDSDTTNTYRDMYDNQLSVSLAGKGTLGLADVLFRQLGGVAESTKQSGSSVTDALAIDYRSRLALAKIKSQAQPLPPKAVAPALPPVSAVVDSVSAPDAVAVDSSSPAAFARSLRDLAVQTGKKLGVEPAVLIAQAALETGWGKHMVKDAQGRSSNNFFNIKAGENWDGAKVSADTAEYSGGVRKAEVAKFRAYASPQESFSDYAQFMQSNPRYAGAIKRGAVAQEFARELQSSGYATDPLYAEKISRIAAQIQADAAANKIALGSNTHVAAR